MAVTLTKELLDVAVVNYQSATTVPCSPAAVRAAVESVIPALLASQDERHCELTYAARRVYDAFAKDLKDGYKTRDKVFAIEILGKALSLQTSIDESQDEVE